MSNGTYYAEKNHLHTAADFEGSTIGYGRAVDRPTAGFAQRLYFASDTGVIYRDNGTSWDAIPGGGAAGKSLYVDGTYGNNSTGRANFAALPFATIGAAVTAASSGDIVYVAPGTYNERNILKNGVNIHGPNADVIYTGSQVGGIFDDSSNGTNGACTANIVLRYIRLNSAQTGSPSGNNGAVNIQNASSNVYVECVDISAAIANGTSAQRCAVYCSGGNLVVNAKRQIANTYYDAVIQEGGTLSVTCDEIYTPPSTGGDGIEWSAGDLRVRCNKISSGGSSVNGVYSSGTYYVLIDALQMEADTLTLEGDFPDADFHIRTTLMRSRGGCPVDISGGAPEIIGATIKGASNGAAVNLTVGNIKLRDCKLVKHGSATNALSGSGNVYIYGSLDVNGPKAAGVTVANGAYPSAGSSVS